LLAYFGGDAEKSLAAVSSIGSLRDELNELGDGEIEAAVSLVAADADPFATQAPTVGSRSTAGERFCILRPHAKGGLGQVSVARDSELNREVALKEIQSRFADNAESRARFVQEAEITGGLEHPGIVPVYGLGQYADGRPFYAMRFIRGDSLEEAVERFHDAAQPGRDSTERSLELRNLLGRFIDVCNAIAYAHSRGVLHRDLKPGNVMLGKYGETLVVDWGLAKPVGTINSQEPSNEPALRPIFGSGSAPTQMGSAIGTPSYMSPEQASGRIDQLGPASDIYSLGATLYCLLTGRPPMAEGSIEEILRDVRNGDFPRPSAVKSDVPKALEAIYLKAMSLKPEDRYGATSEIGEEIEHWLADEPVSASPDSVGQRVIRWLRHHRGLAQMGAAALLVITILSVGSTVLVNGERRRADGNAELYRKQRDISQAAQKQAVSEKRRADENARVAGQQRDLTLETLEILVYEI
jgi:serine/threonine protein kinase